MSYLSLFILGSTALFQVARIFFLLFKPNADFVLAKPPGKLTLLMYYILTVACCVYVILKNWK
jgi:hypothetical protein